MGRGDTADKGVGSSSWGRGTIINLKSDECVLMEGGRGGALIRLQY